MTPRRLLTAAVLTGALVCSSAPAWAQSSWGIGVTRNGGIVFCDRVRSTVWRVDPDGSRTPALDGVSCHAVATGLDGEVRGEATPVDITTTNGVGIWRLDARGVRQWVIPPTLFPVPGQWIAADAEIRALSWTGTGSGSPESAVQRLDTIGQLINLAGGERGQRDGAGRRAAFDNVTGLAAAPDGSVLVIDNGNIRRIATDGTVTTEAVGVVTDSHIGLVNAPGLWAREIGIAADAASEAVVVDPAAGRIVHVDRGGRAHVVWAPSGWAQKISGGRWGWRPSGVAVVGRHYLVLDEWAGPVLIADIIGSPRVMRIDEQGHVARVASVPGWTARIGSALLLLVLLSLLFGRRKRSR